MKKEVIYRKKAEYMTESGQRIEEWRKAGSVELEVGDEDFSTDEDVLYYGSVMIRIKKPQLMPNQQGGISMVGVPEAKEINFTIPGATNVEEAMQMFGEAAKAMFVQLEKEQEEFQAEARRQESQIVTAPSSALMT